MFKRNAAFQTSIPEREFDDSRVVIGFDTSSWLLAEKAAALGRRFILDRSIGHPLSFERLQLHVRRNHLAWVQTFPMAVSRQANAVDATPSWNLLMAMAMLAMLPPVVVVMVMQRQFVRGLVETEK